MAVRQYIGARYVLDFAGDWDNTRDYEGLTVVKYNAYSYVSKQAVPAGTAISNTDFWLLWADPNAQMAELRMILAGYDLDNTVADDIDSVKSLLPAASFDNEHTVADALNGLYATVGDGFTDSFTVSDGYDYLYNRKIEIFESADSMALEPPADGIICYCAGYSAAKDGGDAFYIIEAAANGLLPIALSNGHYANRLAKGTYNALALGFKNNDSADNKPVMDSVCAYSADSGYEKIVIEFPAGIYRFSPTNIETVNISLIGCGNPNGAFNSTGAHTIPSPLVYENVATVFAPISNQTHIIYLGTTDRDKWTITGSTFCDNEIRNIAFYSGKPSVLVHDITAVYQLTDSALVICNQYMGKFEHLAFSCIYGHAMKIIYGYENRFDDLVFRYITPLGNAKDGSLVFTRSHSKTSTDDYISACYFGFMWFESCFGSLIEIADVGIADNYFEGFSYEDYFISDFNNTLDESANTPNSIPMVYMHNDSDFFEGINMSIDKISLNYPANHKYLSGVNNQLMCQNQVFAFEDVKKCPVAIGIDNIMISYASNAFILFAGANDKYHNWHSVKLTQLTRMRANNGTSYDRTNMSLVSGYFADIDIIDATAIYKSSTYPREFEGINGQDITIFSALSDATEAPFYKYPSMLTGIDSNMKFNLRKKTALSLNPPSALDDKSESQRCPFRTQAHKNTFVAIVYIPTDDTADAPIADTYSGGTPDGLTQSVLKAATNVYLVKIDCSSATASRFVEIGNAIGNTTENLLLGYYWE